MKYLSITLGLLCCCCDAGILKPTDFHIPDGEPCSDDFECVSRLCAEGYCQQKSSFPLQTGTTHDDIIKDVEVDKEGAIYVVGEVYEPLFGDSDNNGTLEFLAKYTKEGQLIWFRKVHEIGDHRRAHVLITDLSEILVIGSVYNYTGGIRLERNIWHFDAEGFLLEKYPLAKNDIDFIQEAIINNQGNILIAGGHAAEFAILEYTVSGKKLWRKSFKQPKPAVLTDISVDNQDNIWLSGYIIFPSVIPVAFLCRYTPISDQVSCKQWGDQNLYPNAGSAAHSIEITPNGRVFVLATVSNHHNNGTISETMHFREFTTELASPEKISNVISFDVPINVTTAITDGGQVLFAGNEEQYCKEGFHYSGCTGETFFGRLDMESNVIEKKSILSRDVKAIVTGLDVHTDGSVYVIGATTDSLYSDKNAGGLDGFIAKENISDF